MEYTVEAGDTLTKIAAANPGTTPVSIANANGIKNINEITVGQVLQLPDVAPEAVIPGEEPGIVPTNNNISDEDLLIEKVLEQKEQPVEDYSQGKFTGPGIDVSLEGKGDLDKTERNFTRGIVTEKRPGTYSVDITKGDTDVPSSEASQFAEGGVTEGGVALAPTQKEVEVKPSITGDEEPVLDGPPVIEEEIVEEPGDVTDLGITEESKESAKYTKQIIIDSSPKDSQSVIKDVFAEIDAIGFDPQPKNWYEDIAKNINDKIAKYNTKISDVAEEKMKPTFEGWDKFLAVLGSALGSYGSAMTGVPNFALKIVNDAIDRDTQAFLKSKEIRTKSLENQRMDLIIRRGELLQMAQNRVTQLMQSETLKLSKTKAKADIKATYDKFAQELALNKENIQLVLAGYIKDIVIGDMSIKSSSTKEMRKRYVNSFTGTDSNGNPFIVPGYFARSEKAAEKLTEDQVLAQEAFDILDKLNVLHEDNTKFLPAWASETSQKINTLSKRLEVILKEHYGMGANYVAYEQTLIQGIMPTAKWHEKFGIYKTKSALLRDQFVNTLKNKAKVRGATGESEMPSTAGQENIEIFKGKKIVD